MQNQVWTATVPSCCMSVRVAYKACQLVMGYAGQPLQGSHSDSFMSKAPPLSRTPVADQRSGQPMHWVLCHSRYSLLCFVCKCLHAQVNSWME